MKAQVLTDKGFEMREVPVPVPRDIDVLVKSEACGVCSGDVAIYQDWSRERPAEWKDLVLGHEGTGIIVKAGKAADGRREGERVTANFGGFAEYFCLPGAEAVPVPSGLAPGHVLGEPVACCVSAMNRSGIGPGDRVAVVGCGFMGLVCLQIARIMGAGETAGMDYMPYRLAKARHYGAAATVELRKGGERDQAGDLGVFDVVIEAAGSQSAVDLSTELVREHGRIVLTGYHTSNGGMRTVDMRKWNFKAIDVVNGHTRSLDMKVAAMRQAVDWLGAGRLDTSGMTDYYALEDVARAFEDATSFREGFFKACITFR